MRFDGRVHFLVVPGTSYKAHYYPSPFNQMDSTMYKRIMPFCTHTWNAAKSVAGLVLQVPLLTRWSGANMLPFVMKIQSLGSLRLMWEVVILNLVEEFSARE